jgi:hypothetical protein
MGVVGEHERTERELMCRTWTVRCSASADLRNACDASAINLVRRTCKLKLHIATLLYPVLHTL